MIMEWASFKPSSKKFIYAVNGNVQRIKECECSALTGTSISHANPSGLRTIADKGVEGL